MSEDQSQSDNLHVLLGVSAGIAADKAVALASKLTAAGNIVKTVMTENACRLVGPVSFEAITGNAVYTNMWDSPQQYDIGHVKLVDWADIVVVAPATANIIGKAANGICDDLLSTMLCVCHAKPTLLAPAMNDNMWNNPIVQSNVQRLKEVGFELIGPESGRLACGTDAVGRMAEPENILEAIGKVASQIKRET
jgi:phosphopantothenoylcysteine decarboxylase/phosphopantothenate--cysteine ligase